MKTKNTVLAALIFLMAGFLVSCGNSAKSQATEPKIGIHEAAFMGNVKAIEQHIAFGSDLNVKDDYGSTPLHISATFGHAEIAKRLIKGGADINATAADGSTALHTAGFFCEKEIVQALLEGGVDTKVKNSYGTTARESLMPPFSAVKPIYDQMGRDLGPLGVKFDYDRIESSRPEIADLIYIYEIKQ